MSIEKEDIVLSYTGSLRMDLTHNIASQILRNYVMMIRNNEQISLISLEQLNIIP